MVQNNKELLSRVRYKSNCRLDMDTWSVELLSSGVEKYTVLAMDTWSVELKS